MALIAEFPGEPFVSGIIAFRSVCLAIFFNSLAIKINSFDAILIACTFLQTLSKLCDSCQIKAYFSSAMIMLGYNVAVFPDKPLLRQLIPLITVCGV